MAAPTPSDTLTLTLELTDARSKGRAYSLMIRADAAPLIEDHAFDLAIDNIPNPQDSPTLRNVEVLQHDIALIGKLLADGLRRAFERRAAPPTALRIHISLPDGGVGAAARHWLPWEQLPERPEVAEALVATGINPRLVPVIRLADYQGSDQADAPREAPGIVRVAIGVADTDEPARAQAERLREEIGARSGGDAAGVFQLGSVLPEVLLAGCDVLISSSSGLSDESQREVLQLPGDPLGERRWITLDVLQSALRSSSRPPRLIWLFVDRVAGAARARLLELAAGLAELAPAVLLLIGGEYDDENLLQTLGRETIDLNELLVDQLRSLPADERRDRIILYAARPDLALRIPPVPQAVFAALRDLGFERDDDTEEQDHLSRSPAQKGWRAVQRAVAQEVAPASEGTDPYAAEERPAPPASGGIDPYATQSAEERPAPPASGGTDPYAAEERPAPPASGGTDPYAAEERPAPPASEGTGPYASEGQPAPPASSATDPYASEGQPPPASSADLIAALVSRLADESPGVRQAAVQNLSPLLDNQADLIPAVATMLADASPGVRQAAVQALSPLLADRPDLVPAIRARLEDASPGVRRAAMQAISRLDTPPSGAEGSVGDPAGPERVAAPAPDSPIATAARLADVGGGDRQLRDERQGSAAEDERQAAGAIPRADLSEDAAPAPADPAPAEAARAGEPELPDVAAQALPAPERGPTGLPPPGPPQLQIIVQPAIQQLMQRYVEPACRLRVEVSQTTVELIYYDEYGGQAQPPQRYSSPCTIAPETLLALANQPTEYGRALFAALFHDAPSAAQDPDRATIHGFREAYRHGGSDLRVELALDPNSPALHAVRWEYLCPPLPPGATEGGDAGRPLAVRERAPLYRLNDDPVQHLKLADKLKVVVAICAPSDLGQPGNALLSGLAVVDSAQERAIITSDEALGRLVREGMATQVLLDRSLDGRAVTLARLRREAAEAGVLHLICHGAYWQDQFYLVMEREDGTAQLVRPRELEDALSDRWPALILLCTCQSASARYGDALSGLGARLSRAGAPAVIAMQDLLPIKTAQVFNQYFYDHLGRSGRADMALAATRLDLLISPLVANKEVDWAIPVLMMRAGAGEVYRADAEHARHMGELVPRVRDYAELPGEGDPTGRIIRTALSSAGVAQLLPVGLLDLLQASLSGGDDTTPLAQDRPAVRAAIRAEVRIDPQDLKQYVQTATPLQLPDTLYRQVATALSAGKHIILIGPPGTGKTTLAQAIGGYAAARQMSAGTTLVTATADWTSFDTVGGYMPTAQGRLQFRPGRLLEALARGNWLVIDEINRADADKAFGELFSVLAGQGVDLPYSVAGRAVRILAPRGQATVASWWPAEPLGSCDYVRHHGWRVIGAMNVYDKASLFALSFALMRRFAFIDVDLPGHAISARLLTGWLGAASGRPPLRTRLDWLLDLPAAITAEAEPPAQPNPLMQRRALGPAIVKDLAEYLRLSLGAAAPPADLTLLAEGLLLYVAPQLDGLDQEGIQAIYAFLVRLLHPDTAARPIDIADLPIPAADADVVRRDEGGRALLARIRQLYPHLPAGHWEGSVTQA